ncbi:hypothetical protein BU17DRAFT_81725 [Hysterangium stoloniferum]|nr:hypothetical protein BU17DRAFT_81725 [Hysterangium stoloniferum]
MTTQEGPSSPWNASVQSFNDYSSDEDEMDWEEVDVPIELPVSKHVEEPSMVILENLPELSKPLEITLDVAGKKPETAKKSVISHAERVLRLQVHKIHTISLISNGWIRNKYLNDPLLHARLMSLTPLPLQSSFTHIHKKRQPDANRRGRLFEAAVMRLTQWWQETFFDAQDRGNGEIQNRTFDEVMLDLQKRNRLKEKDFEKGEIIRSSKSLQKHALMRYGSRDVSAQLFTALCRALGIPARLIISIQSVPWKASIGKKNGSSKLKNRQTEVVQDIPRSNHRPHAKGKGKAKALFPGSGQSLDGNQSSVGSDDKGKAIIRLRKQRSKGRTLGSVEKGPIAPPGGYPPAQWTEVFSRADGRWLPVDLIRNFVDKCTLFQPPPHDKRNRMVYVLAFEEDGYARDVTQRYVREFTNTLSRTRGGGKGKKEWWDKVMAFITRPYRLHRDDVEDAELLSRQVIEGMPTSIAAFKDHPIYVLERHILRDEILHPRTEIGRFRGEPVFARANIVSNLKAAENWMRSGRVVTEGEQPMKFVKVRAVTINRRRAIGIAGEDEPVTAVSGKGEGVMQGLYAEHQTEIYHPPPVVNGKVPKNDFGNIDLYVDTMLPSGATHIPYKGAAKIAKELRYDYAEAVTGFEFKNRRAFPLINGIVIATENESAFLEAYWTSAQDAEEKERIRKEERVLKRWTRLVQGLRIRKRLQEQYANDPSGTIATHGVDNREDIVQAEAGGFLLETADNVVQAYSLPKPLHVVDPSPRKEDDQAPDEDNIIPAFISDSNPLDEHGSEENEMEEILSVNSNLQANVIPKTLQELAEANPDVFMAQASESAVCTPQTNVPGMRRANAKQSRPRKSDSKQGSASRADASRLRKRARSTNSSSEEEAHSSPKRSRVTSTSTPATTRTLRARLPKSEEKKRQEREQELAFRRAIQE